MSMTAVQTYSLIDDAECEQRILRAREQLGDLAKVVSFCLDGAPEPAPAIDRFAAELLLQRKGLVLDAVTHTLHRARERLTDASVVVVVAGMEGALPSVVGGIVDAPVIAVPTSVGYGASFGGLAALLGMLNSCSSGVTVVNIDNGFGAGYAASLINRDR